MIVVWEGCECGLGGWRVWSGRVVSVVWEGGECGLGGWRVW